MSDIILDSGLEKMVGELDTNSLTNLDTGKEIINQQNDSLTDPRKLGGVGASEVGKLFTGQGLKAKTAHSFAYEKALELINGYKNYISTNATLHGINSEIDAFHDVIQKKYPKAVLRSADSIFLSEKEKKCYWATPDVTEDFIGITIDAKCPYTPYTYWNNVKKIPNQYLAQNQMQMLATKHKKGAICLYLTAGTDAIDDYGNKKEYKIPVEKRSKFIYQEADAVFQKEITQRIDGFFPMRDVIYDSLVNAPEITDEELFDMCAKKQVKKFKENSNLLVLANNTVKCSGEYYTYKDLK